MNLQYQIDMANFLRASLRHFQVHRDFGDQTDVLEIERLLLRRIEEIESGLVRTPAMLSDETAA